jgi:hypothetical protein
VDLSDHLDRVDLSDHLDRVGLSDLGYRQHQVIQEALVAHPDHLVDRVVQ